MKRFAIIFFSFLLILPACAVKKNIQRSENRIKTDSLARTSKYIKIEILKDTQFIIRPDSSTIRALIQCDQQGRAYIKEIISLQAGKNIRQKFFIKNNVITMAATIDSQAIYFQYKKVHEKQIITTTRKSKEKTKIEQTKTTVKKRMPAWIWFILIGGIVYLFFKYIFPFVKPFL